MSRVILFTVSAALLFAGIRADDPCRFEYPAKGVIDLSSLAKTDGTAAFPDQPAGAGSSYSELPCWSKVKHCSVSLGYSYNPCKPFTEGAECTNVALCQGKRRRADFLTDDLRDGSSVQWFETSICSGESGQCSMESRSWSRQ